MVPSSRVMPKSWRWRHHDPWKHRNHSPNQGTSCTSLKPECWTGCLLCKNDFRRSTFLTLATPGSQFLTRQADEEFREVQLHIYRRTAPSQNEVRRNSDPFTRLAGLTTLSWNKQPPDCATCRTLIPTGALPTVGGVGFVRRLALLPSSRRCEIVKPSLLGSLQQGSSNWGTRTTAVRQPLFTGTRPEQKNQNIKKTEILKHK